MMDMKQWWNMKSWVKTKKYYEKNIPHCHLVQYIPEAGCLDI